LYIHRPGALRVLRLPDERAARRRRAPAPALPPLPGLPPQALGAARRHWRRAGRRGAVQGKTRLARWYIYGGFADEACWAAERVQAITLEHWEVAPDEAAPGWAGVGDGGSGFGDGVASVAAGRGPSPGAPAPAPATPEWSLRTGPRDRHPPGPGLRPGLPAGSGRSPGPAPSPGPAADAQVVYAMGERYSVIICHDKRKVNCHGRTGAEAVRAAEPPALSGAACARAPARRRGPVYTLCLRVSHHGAPGQPPKRLVLPWHAMVCVLWYLHTARHQRATRRRNRLDRDPARASPDCLRHRIMYSRIVSARHTPHRQPRMPASLAARQRDQLGPSRLHSTAGAPDAVSCRGGSHPGWPAVS
jgi:hypothetical protein